MTIQDQILEAKQAFNKMISNPKLCWLCLDHDALNPTLGLCGECREKLRS